MPVFLVCHCLSQPVVWKRVFLSCLSLDAMRGMDGWKERERRQGDRLLDDRSTLLHSELTIIQVDQGSNTTVHQGNWQFSLISLSLFPFAL